MPSPMTMPYMLPPNSNMGAVGANAMSHQSLTMNNREKNAFIRESQGQQSLRMNQIMAPSMPNIAHSAGYPANISSSQSMQNVNMIHPNNGMNYHNYMPSATNASQPQAQPQYMYQQEYQQQQLQQNTLSRGQSKLIEMGEMLKRRQQRQQDMMPMHSLDVSNQAPVGPLMLSPTGSQSEHHHPHLMSHSNVAKAHPAQAGLGYMQNSPMSPVKQLPPTAPKPQVYFLS